MGDARRRPAGARSCAVAVAQASATRLARPAADRLVLRRIRACLGGNLRYLVSGSAPMPLWLLERFHAMGLLVLEAYG